MNINEEETLDSRMVKVIRDIKNNDMFEENGQNMRGQLINSLHNILPLFNNVEEVDAGNNGILPKREYFELWKRDLDAYLDQQYMGENGIINLDGLAESIVSEAYTIINNYINNPQGGRRKRSRKARKSRKMRKSQKRRPKSHRRRN